MLPVRNRSMFHQLKRKQRTFRLEAIELPPLFTKCLEFLEMLMRTLSSKPTICWSGFITLVSFFYARRHDIFHHACLLLPGLSFQILDTNPSAGAAERLQAVDRAYQVVGDEDVRKHYESFGETGISRSGAHDETTGQSGGGGIHNNASFPEGDMHPEFQEQIQSIRENDIRLPAPCDERESGLSDQSASNSRIKDGDDSSSKQVMNTVAVGDKHDGESLEYDKNTVVPVSSTWSKGEIDEQIGSSTNSDGTGNNPTGRGRSQPSLYPDMKGQVEAIGRKKVGKVAVRNRTKRQSDERDKKSRSPFHPSNFRQQVHMEDVTVEDSFFQRAAQGPSARGKGGSCKVCGGSGVTVQISRTRHGEFKMQQPCRTCCLVSVASDDMISSVGFSQRMNNYRSQDGSTDATKTTAENLWPRRR
jgi:DnaJ-class molecular chaperone